MKPLQNSIKVILNTLAGKVVDVGTLADGRVIVYDSGTDQYTHVDLPQVTFETLLANGDIGTAANQVAYGNHLHTGVYELLENKSLSILTDYSSDVKYPSVKAVKTYADAVAGRISTGCTTPPDLIDNGDGTATITSTTVNIYPAPGYIGTMQTFVIPQATLSFTDGVEEYVSVRFNVGNPIYYKETVGSDLNHSDILPIFVVWRLGTVIHSLNFDSLGAGLANKAQSAMYHTDLYKISADGGMMITETTSPAPRTINVTSSLVYTGAIHQDVGYFTSASDMMTEAINTPTGWTYSNKTVYNNTQFNNGTTLGNISNNKYAVRWWYRSIGDSKQLFYVLGTVGNYNNPTDAALEMPRTDLSPILKRHCMLIGRSIISYNAVSGVTQSLLSKQYSYSSVVNHDDTANISLVGSGITYGHINDQAQTIYGIKTFNSSPLVPTAVANTNSTVAASTAYADAKVANTITSGLTTIAPSQDSVFSALALKVDKSVLVDAKSLTGFLAGDGIDVSYNWTNRTITLTGDLRYMWRGVVKTLTSPWTSAAHTATEGNWYLMSTDGTNFTWSSTIWAFEDCMVSAVKYKATSAASFAIRETHGVMDYQTHEELHSQLGTYLVSGGKPVVGTYVENSAVDSATTPSFSAAVIKDEDSRTTVPLWNEGTYTTAYVGVGGVMTFGLTSTTPFIATTNTYIQVNNTVTGAMVAGSTGKFYNVYQVLIPSTSDAASQKYRMVMLQPQATFSSLATAQAEDTRGLNFGDIASSTAEYVVYTRLTFVTLASDSNIGKCRIATGGITYITGNRASQISVSGIATNNHAVLSNLTWAVSGHIGTESSLAGFDSGGLATNVLLNTLSPVAGSSSITTVGTITTGTWSATSIAVAKGGTGLTAIGTALQVLRVNAGGTALEYVTPPWLTTAVTSVAVSVPTGLTIVSGSPVTTTGTIAIGLQSGYSIPTTSSQTNWDTAYTDRNKWDGGSTGLVAATGRTSLGATVVGSNLFTVTNPSAITFLRVNADNTVSLLDATAFKIAIGAGSSTGTVTSVDMTVPLGLSITGNPVTSSGTLALTYAAGYGIPTTAKQTEWDTAYSQTRQWDGGSTGLVAATGRTSLGLGSAAQSASTDFAVSSVYPATGLTTGYLPYKSATVLANSPIWTDATNVGIGTETLSEKLNIAGDTYTTGMIYKGTKLTGTSAPVLLGYKGVLTSYASVLKAEIESTSTDTSRGFYVWDKRTTDAHQPSIAVANPAGSDIFGMKWNGAGNLATYSTTTGGFFFNPGSGKTGFGITPTAVLHLKAGTAAANTAPLKFTTGVNLTNPEAGTFEFDGTHFYGTIGTTRYQIDQQAPVDATTLVKGIIKLAGDLGGTADLPTVPGLANKAPISGSANYVNVSPVAAQSGNIWMTGSTTLNGNGGEGLYVKGGDLGSGSMVTRFVDSNDSELFGILGNGTARFRSSLLLSSLISTKPRILSTAADGTVTAISDGGAGQFLKTDGNGVYNFADAAIPIQENTDIDIGTEMVATIANTSGAIFFDYLIKNGTNVRAGTVISVNNGSSIEYTEQSTSDIGDTSQVTLSVVMNGSNVELRATVTTDNWSIRASIRKL